MSVWVTRSYEPEAGGERGASVSRAREARRAGAVVEIDLTASAVSNGASGRGRQIGNAAAAPLEVPGPRSATSVAPGAMREMEQGAGWPGSARNAPPARPHTSVRTVQHSQWRLRMSAL